MTPTTDLQKLLAEATKGPWRTCNVLPDLGHIYGSIGRLATSIGGETNRTKANARLIAMAPDLAARVIELEAENKRLREALHNIMVEGDEIYAASMSEGCDGPALLDFTGRAANIASATLARAALKGGE